MCFLNPLFPKFHTCQFCNGIFQCPAWLKCGCNHLKMPVFNDVDVVVDYYSIFFCSYECVKKHTDSQIEKDIRERILKFNKSHSAPTTYRSIK